MSRGVDENSKQPTWREKFSGLVLFAADWFKDWCDFSEPIREGNEVKTQYYQLISRPPGSFPCVYVQIGRCEYFVDTQSKSGLSEIVRFEAIFLFFLLRWNQCWCYEACG